MPVNRKLDDKTLVQLVQYIVAELNEQGRRPSTIQVVKFLYLVDIEHQRARGRPLTGLEWIYHRYGPYAFELQTLAEESRFDLSVEMFTSEGHEGRAFTASRPAEFPPAIIRAKSIVDRVLRIWGQVSTPELLDYVYYSTGPMQDAKQGDVLDFKLVEPEIGNYDIRFREGKQLKALRKRHETPLPLSGRIKVRLTGPPDDLFLEVMRGLDEQD